jgi:aconitate hydratase
MPFVNDVFNCRRRLPDGRGSGGPVAYASLPALAESAGFALERLPYCVRIVLEALLRQVDGRAIREEDVLSLARWPQGDRVLPFKPARVLMQDFTGVPALVDLAALRDALAERGGDPARINPVIPVDLVIDHSLQVDLYGSVRAPEANCALELRRNRERYEFLRWGEAAFDRVRVVPPGKGIIHQVNLEHLAPVVRVERSGDETVAFPDTLVGTDSHTTMINGIGVLGWGVGGIEAEAAMLGQPLDLPWPLVVGLRLHGALPRQATATDLVLTVTERLRRYGVVGKMVEFFGPGADELDGATRALISNMAPEYGATAGFFPVDRRTLAYLAQTGRADSLIALIEAYTRAQRLFREADSPAPEYTDVLELDLGEVEPSIAGPRRPQDRIPIGRAAAAWDAYIRAARAPEDEEAAPDSRGTPLRHGSVVIAAITSCTNTSNPPLMIGAGLLARRAVELGLRVPPWVKTSLAPGSRVVSRYLEAAGLTCYLQALGFHLVGYGCTTCIGNSGPLDPGISRAIAEHDLRVAAVLSGNRNFEGRIHPGVQANYLASPPLVVAYALAGRVDIDLLSEPLGRDPGGKPVMLADIWPDPGEVRAACDRFVEPGQFREEYAALFSGGPGWDALAAGREVRYPWSGASTYIRRPPFFEPAGPGKTAGGGALKGLQAARVLAVLGDSVTTDHISPAGAIPEDSEAGRWLCGQGVAPEEFNSYGSRRGNHEVMMRGSFASIRVRNLLVPEQEGGVTRVFPEREVMSIYAASELYRRRQAPLLILAGKEYGTGSSRDWAAKGPALLGVRAVIAESFERIHRSNLAGVGILPLEFLPGESASSLRLTGSELYAVEACERPGQLLTVEAGREDGGLIRFRVKARLDSELELEYAARGGILSAVLNDMIRE